METNHMNLVQTLSELGEAEFNAVAQLVAEEKQKRDKAYQKEKNDDWVRLIKTIKNYEAKYGSMALSIIDPEYSEDLDYEEVTCHNSIDANGIDVLMFQIVN